MKVFTAALIIAAGFVVMLPTQASAWACYAGSRTGSYGWGTSGSLSRAKTRALWECARRTPRGYVCHIRYCR
jgi:hypothetical protein